MSSLIKTLGSEGSLTGCSELTAKGKFSQQNQLLQTEADDVESLCSVALTVFQSPLLHVGLLFIRKTQKTEDAVLERTHFELCPELLFTCMEVASHMSVREARLFSRCATVSTARFKVFGREAEDVYGLIGSSVHLLNFNFDLCSCYIENKGLNIQEIVTAHVWRYIRIMATY